MTRGSPIATTIGAGGTGGGPTLVPVEAWLTTGRPVTSTRVAATIQVPVTTGPGNCMTSAISPIAPAAVVTRVLAVIFAVLGTPDPSTPAGSTETGCAIAGKPSDHLERAVHRVEPCGAQLGRAAVRGLLD